MSAATERLALRLDPEEKRDLTDAAGLCGMSVAAFVRSVARREARQVLVERDSVTLSWQEGRRLLQALGQPFAPDPRLRRALERGDKRGL
ncbi:MAG TPA: DUF1778 domain-containing protein [Gammaproteobacteria bacterium]|nr:DUF1778 domain-containing protein [Gammaproteobacteria bacterium]